MDMNPLRAFGVLAMAMLVIGGAAGCGSMRPGAGPPVVAKATTPRQRAQAAVNAAITLVVVPQGARRVTTVPAVLRQPAERPVTPNLVSTSASWQAAGVPRQVLDSIAAHLPPSSGSAELSAGGHLTRLTETFDVRPPSQQASKLVISVADAGPGQTAIRADAQVVWQSVRPASERIPAGATAVLVTANPGLSRLPQWPERAIRRPVSATVTDPEAVRQIVAAVDALPAAQPGTYSCPADNGGWVRMTFRAGPRGPVLAVAKAGMAGCGFVSLTVRGVPQPGLSGGGLVTTALLVSGLVRS